METVYDEEDLLWIERALLESKAFSSLSGVAQKVLIYFLLKADTSEGRIEFTYKEAEERYGISKKAFSRVLSGLIGKGFIDVTVPGIGIGRVKTIYALSERWRKWGTDAFVQKERIKQIGYRFPSGAKHWKHAGRA